MAKQEWTIVGDTAQFTTKYGDTVMIDAGDLPRLSGLTVRYTSPQFKYRSVFAGRDAKGVRVASTLARIVLGHVPTGVRVYHIDSNPFNNRKQNLAVAKMNTRTRLTLENGVVKVHTKRGVALFDAEDLGVVSSFSVTVSVPRNRNCNTPRVIFRAKTKPPKAYIAARIILGVVDRRLAVDHVDGNPLDNRRSNLRICTPSQNNCNRPPISLSGFKGVTFVCGRSKPMWKAQIGYKGRNKSLGLFDNPEAAARAYDAEAIKAFGEFAWLNFNRARPQNVRRPAGCP
jgi:hypothetical protein